MGKKRTSASAGRTVTAKRAARLYRLVKLLGTGAKSRDALCKELRLDIRSFYRDLDLLRASGLHLRLRDRNYVLPVSAVQALGFVPFPDPQLSLAEAQALARGRSAAHAKLKLQIEAIVKPPKKPAAKKPKRKKK